MILVSHAAPSAKRAKVDQELEAAQPEQADNMDLDGPIRQEEQPQPMVEDEAAREANYVVSMEPLVIVDRVLPALLASLGAWKVMLLSVPGAGLLQEVLADLDIKWCACSARCAWWQQSNCEPWALASSCVAGLGVLDASEAYLECCFSKAAA